MNAHAAQAPRDASSRTIASPFAFEQTVERLTDAVERSGMTLFTVVDHAGGARKAGLEMNDAKLLVFGNPRGGTPVMRAAPLAALDLPLRALVWADDSGAVWVSHQDIEEFGRRHGVPEELLVPLAKIGDLVAAALAQ
jgi:uncharacterized protein (DUF302 family)